MFSVGLVMTVIGLVCAMGTTKREGRLTARGWLGGVSLMLGPGLVVASLAIWLWGAMP